jgi:hypothetical protein
LRSFCALSFIFCIGPICHPHEWQHNQRVNVWSPKYPIFSFWWPLFSFRYTRCETLFECHYEKNTSSAFNYATFNRFHPVLASCTNTPYTNR